MTIIAKRINSKHNKFSLRCKTINIIPPYLYLFTFKKSELIWTHSFPIKSVLLDSDSDANMFRPHSSKTLPGGTQSRPKRSLQVENMNVILSAMRFFLEVGHVTKHLGILPKKQAFKQHFFLTGVERCYSPNSKQQWFISIMAKKNRTVWMDYSIAGSCGNESSFLLNTPPFSFWVAALLEGRPYEEETL